MATIETAYGIGDSVWYADITTETRQHPCPDCKGAKEWKAVSPAGGEFTFPCPRCSASYHSKHELSLTYHWWVPATRKLTIGQVRAYAGPDGKNEYMCVETGVGSGNLYYEDRLFAAEEDARRAAQTLADVNNADAKGWVSKQYNRSLRVCDYELKDVSMQDAIQSARRSQYRIGHLIEDLRTAETLQEVRDFIEAWSSRESEDDDAP